MAELSPHLKALALALSLDTSIQTAVTGLLSQYWSPDSVISVSDYAPHCAVLAVSRMLPAASALSLSQVLAAQSTVDIIEFFKCLQTFIEQVPLPRSVRTSLREVQVGFMFSYTFYKKFEDVWKAFVPGKGTVEIEVKELTWLLFIVTKADVLKTRDIALNALLLLGTMHIVLTSLPEDVQTSVFSRDPDTFLVALSEKLKTEVKFIRESAEKVRLEVGNLITNRVLESATDPENENAWVSCPQFRAANVQRLRTHFAVFLTPDNIDEREFLVQDKIKVPETRMYQGNVAATPMSQAMEINKWLLSSGSESSESLLSQIKTHCEKCEKSLESKVESRLEEFKVTIRNAFAEKSLENANAELSIKLYLRLLEQLLRNKHRKRAESDLQETLKSDSFHRSLFAGSIETVLYAYNIDSVSFEDVLDFAKITAFDFWKILSSVYSIDPAFPRTLKRHFKLIEEKIITSLAWVRVSPVARLIADLECGSSYSGDSGNYQEIDYPYNYFFKQVVSFAARRVLAVTNLLGIEPTLQEHLWLLVKRVLSDQTELLVDRHLDQILLCVIAGGCETHKTQVKVKNVLEAYGRVHPEETNIVSRAVTATSSVVNLPDFYRSVMLPIVKEMETIPVSLPRIPVLSPEGSLISIGSQQGLVSPFPLQSPFPSPMLTPTSQRLYIIHGPQPSDRHIDFEIEERKLEQPPTHLMTIFQQPKEPLP